MPTWNIGRRTFTTTWERDELNKWFYEGYDPGFLSHKAEAVRYVLEQLGLFTHWR